MGDDGLAEGEAAISRRQVAVQKHLQAGGAEARGQALDDNAIGEGPAGKRDSLQAGALRGSAGGLRKHAHEAAVKGAGDLLPGDAGEAGLYYLAQ